MSVPVKGRRSGNPPIVRWPPRVHSETIEHMLDVFVVLLMRFAQCDNWPCGTVDQERTRYLETQAFVAPSLISGAELLNRIYIAYAYVWAPYISLIQIHIGTYAYTA